MDNIDKTRDIDEAKVIRLPRSEITFSCSYPKENPKDSVESITDALKHIGIMDGLEKVSFNKKTL